MLSRYSHVNWALGDQAMISGANVLTGILLARYLGLEEFGRFTLAWMAVLFVNSLQHAMIIAPMMSIGPKQNPDEEPAYMGAVMFQQIAFSGLAFALVLAGVHLSTLAFPEWGVENFALPLASVALVSQGNALNRPHRNGSWRGSTLTHSVVSPQMTPVSLAARANWSLEKPVCRLP